MLSTPRRLTRVDADHAAVVAARQPSGSELPLRAARRRRCMGDLSTVVLLMLVVVLVVPALIWMALGGKGGNDW
jgi:hypothetical protein